MAATDIQTALSQSKKTREQRSLWGILKMSASEWTDADAMTWAAAIACYAVLALAPMLVVAVKVATVLLRGQSNAIQKVRENAGNWVGPEGASAIGAILDKMVQQHGGVIASIISGVLVVISVGGVFSEFQQAMNRVWKLKPKPGQAMMAFIRARLKSVVVLGIAAVLVIGSVFVAGWINSLTKELGMGWKFLSWSIDFIATLVALTLIFGMVFKTVPDAEIGWKTTVIGAVLTAVLFALGKYGLTLYFKYAAPSSAFGAVGSLAAVLIWIYYSAQIVLFGSVFTQVYSKVQGHGVRPSKHAEFLSECDETETATPSDEPPGAKPARPSRHESAGLADDYASVLGGHVSGGGEDLSQEQIEFSSTPGVRTTIIAALGLSLGALLGGYGATRLRHSAKPRARDIAAVGLDQRMERVEHKLGHISRIRHYLEQDNLNQRIDLLEKHIRQAARQAGHVTRHARRSERWTERLVRTVKSYL
jgi:membrane protein